MCPVSDHKFATLSDNDLCILVCKGIEPAFEEITKRYKGLIRTISKEYSYPGFDSADFMQLGLMGLYSACKSYSAEKEASFKNFAALCIRRRYISLVRSLSNQKVIPPSAVVSIDDTALSGFNPDPEAVLLDKEADKSFLDFVKDRLSFMELCALKGYVNGMTYEEIAKSTGLDTKAVDNALQRVRKKLIR